MPESQLSKLIEKKISYRSKMIATVAVCVLASVSMVASKGQTGVGWGIFGLYFIWS